MTTKEIIVRYLSASEAGIMIEPRLGCGGYNFLTDNRRGRRLRGAANVIPFVIRRGRVYYRRIDLLKFIDSLPPAPAAVGRHRALTTSDEVPIVVGETDHLVLYLLGRSATSRLAPEDAKKLARDIYRAADKIEKRLAA